MRKLLLFLLPLGTALVAPLMAAGQVVTITAGSLTSALSPINHANPGGTCEIIYLQSSINQAGSITRLAFEKNDGTDLGPLTGVAIYLKTTTATDFTTGALDTTGYQRVYTGGFTNATTSGYQEVLLAQPFAYANTAGTNLSVLVLRRNGNVQSTIGPRARFVYGTTPAPARLACRRYTGADPVTSATTLTATNILPNLRLTFGTPMATRHAANRLAMNVFPNPATSMLTLHLPTATRQQVEVQVLDLLGRTVQPATLLQPAPDGTLRLPVRELAAGTYLLRVRQDEAVATQRFLKE